ncbi:uncharacterized protein VDAG_02583 [Verticillium dahliae VdLs.17]|uniref:Uncharacterized protein n=1 Tax=Verticillium dahliae (strain VdLs.17 / ATCC MYA-4575 / FGSC 10137) TaxID=498257 RepID=G2WYA1_VERDV|nr:uncharacterized protein VDAG_02583 [Verticillium dahliae VdLs.17]EGY21059.1 hypothetical protein VDAG_02583 [Verticillium dahliae VdLs.17]
MLARSLLLLASLALAAASPVRKQESSSCAQKTPTLPVNGGGTQSRVWAVTMPLNSDGTTKFGASASNPFKAPAPLDIPGQQVPFLGVHYFDGEGVPTFLTGTSEADAKASVLKALQGR